MPGLGIILMCGAVLRPEVLVVKCDILEINARASDNWVEPDNHQIIVWNFHPVLGRQCKGWYWVRQTHNASWSEYDDKKCLSWYKNGFWHRIEYRILRFTYTPDDPEVEERNLMTNTYWGTDWGQLFDDSR